MSNLAEQEDEVIVCALLLSLHLTLSVQQLTALEAILGSDYREIESPLASEEANPTSRRKTIRVSACAR